MTAASTQGADYGCSSGAGYWEPYQIEGTSDALINKWGGATFDHFQRLVQSPAAPAAGAPRRAAAVACGVFAIDANVSLALVHRSRCSEPPAAVKKSNHTLE